MEWKIIKDSIPHDKVLEMVKEYPDEMLVKSERDKMGICFYCAACGAWLKYDSHSASCPYVDSNDDSDWGWDL